MFVLGRVAWLLVDPRAVTAWLSVACAALLLLRRPRAGRVAAYLLGAHVLFWGFLPTGALLLGALEDRFPPGPLPARVDGVVVLGGGLHDVPDGRRVSLGADGDRLAELAWLARRFPDARVVFSGGNGQLRDLPPEAAAARALLERWGVTTERMVFEDRARNTAENARLARERAQPAPGETWLLVTSAAHMPRAVGCFRAAGWNVTPWPVGFSTTGEVSLASLLAPADGLQAAAYAQREWLGLLAYRLLGRTTELFPAP